MAFLEKLNFIGPLCCFAVEKNFIADRQNSDEYYKSFDLSFFLICTNLIIIAFIDKKHECWERSISVARFNTRGCQIGTLKFGHSEKDKKF